MRINIYANNVEVCSAPRGVVDLTFEVDNGIDVIEEILSGLSKDQIEKVKETLNDY